MTDPVGCPSCGAPVTGAPVCASCGLPLSGPLAYRLWQVDQQLAALRKQGSALEAERADLMARLRAGDVGTPAPVVQAPAAPWPAAPARKESSPQQVQNTLLTLGAILLAGAGIVFAAVTYRHLGVAGRAAVLLALTAAAAWAPTRLLPRGLTASAEAVAAVAVVLCVLDLYALRKAGVAEDVEASSYWAVGTAGLAAAVGAYAAVVPVRVARCACALLAQLPLPLLLDRWDATAAAASPLLAAQAGADAAVAARLPISRDVRGLLAVLGGLLGVASLVTATAAVEDEQRAAWVGF
ncbi:MAG TPA: zinc ribbon domain-containing protein, partial [Mycobacteriales bacterium]|nr:zinc ribbon domain-containing protein [Mycobacteriales bacterium]